MNIKKRIEELVKIIDKANFDYYDLSNPTLSDFEYDKYYLELLNLEKQYPELKKENSPTVRVGGEVLSNFKKEKHEVSMLSLSNVFNLEDILEFDKKIKEKNIIPEYVCELKIDGLSISLIYEKGILKKGITRGNGEYGENVTNNIKTIKDIPLKLKEKIDIEVRGEVYIDNKTFENINEDRKNKNLDLFKNPRNTASGTLKQLDSKIVASRNLKCFVYHVPNSNLKTHFDCLEYLKDLGFKVNKNNKLLNDINEVLKYIKKHTEKREKLEYEIDGVVIKLNNLEQQKTMGYTSKFPKWATAYKFAAEEVVTNLKNIIFTVGRTGKITPNAIFDPVLIQGSIVKRATLHNENNIIKKGIKINDDIVVRKAGDIIPEVAFVKNSNKDSIQFKMIKNCPICNYKLEKINAEHYCLNDKCLAKEIEKIIHFSSRDAMNIEGLGERIIEDFYNFNYLKNFSDVYLLKNFKNELMQIDNFGEKSIEKLLNNIEISKGNSLEKLVFGLGIKEVGIKTSKILSKQFRNLENLIKAKKEELNEIYEIGEVVSNNVIEYFSDKRNQAIIKNLKSYNVNFKYLNEEIYNEKITNKTFVITGTLSVSRNEIKELIEKNSGKITESITKKTDYLILGDNPGSKLKKAVKLNIEVIKEEDLMNLLSIR